MRGEPTSSRTIAKAKALAAFGLTKKAVAYRLDLPLSTVRSFFSYHKTKGHDQALLNKLIACIHDE